MKSPTQYDQTHPYCGIYRGRSVMWLGDPARGEFTPADKQKRRPRRRRK